MTVRMMKALVAEIEAIPRKGPLLKSWRTCSVCRNSFETLERLRAHCEENHPKLYKEAQRKDAWKLASGKYNARCRYCLNGRATGTAGNAIRTRKTHEAQHVSPQDYPCPIRGCLVVSCAVGAANSHGQCHCVDRGVWRCPECGLACAEKANLMKHMWVMHFSSGGGQGQAKQLATKGQGYAGGRRLAKVAALHPAASTQASGQEAKADDVQLAPPGPHRVAKQSRAKIGTDTRVDSGAGVGGQAPGAATGGAAGADEEEPISIENV